MIRYWEQNKLIVLETAHTAYWIGLSYEVPVCLYWGAPIDTRDMAMLAEKKEHSSFSAELWRESAEYPTWDGRTFGETALRTDEPIFLCTRDVHIEDNRLTLTLADELTGHSVCLSYDVDEAHDVIVKSAEITAGTKPLTLRHAASGVCCLPDLGLSRTAHYTAGTWAGEFQRRRAPLGEGTLKLGSSRGMSGPHMNPSIIVTDAACDDTGMAYAALLGWSGNWQITASQSAFGHTSIIAGFGGDDFKAVLGAGEHLQTPPLYLGCSAQGVDGLSRTLHDFERDVLRPQGRPRRVLYNSWEATTFAVNAKAQMVLADRAAQMGVELFVVDDGWFGARDSDRAGLGDWVVNPQKFPRGLEELIDHVKALGMTFGLWVEPESVNPDSDLFRAHPDWIHRLPDREPITLRSQYLLDFGRPEVEAFALGMLRGLLARYDITYLKWDMNRPFADIDGQIAPMAREKHVLALYRILETLKREYPDVDIEACSGGGARVDLGMVRRTDQFWASDNTDPLERLSIQEGCSLCYAPAFTSCWVTDTPVNSHRAGRDTLPYKFHVAMCGTLGIGADISKFTAEQIEQSAKLVTAYKRVRHLVLKGDQYRAGSPTQQSQTAVEFAAKDGRECVVFAFLHSQRYGREASRVRLHGLKPDARYRCVETGEVASGSSLQNLGVRLPLEGDFDSAMRHYQLVEDTLGDATHTG